MSKKKVILLIMDGIGISEKEKGNAVFHAQKPHLEYLRNTYPHTTLYASGTYVGLPENQMGNSEVGHLNIGAGRIVYTGLSLINKELETGEFYSNEAFLKAIQHAKENNSKVNIIGLVSKGGVHSSFEHIKALIHLLHKNGVAGVLHAFSDGRDVATNSFLSDLKELLPLLDECNVKLGSISGRYYGMDRDKNWSRNMEAYKVLIGESHNSFSSPIQYVEESYKNNVFDEMIVPALNSSYEIKDVTIQDNDSVIIANFRPDRSRQISHLIFDSNYY
ncbi:MAG: 2,3-bisphosphoglycerate-independent phosphoglycerate mutase, partial [Mycoplasmataceae bacterium]|nr:2,3-bisphosphoglycerate-independent phosphoglycerate mutase [Mycoplasmataceae bacterium]